MKVKNIMAGVFGLAAVVCGCTKNNPEKEPVAVQSVTFEVTEVKIARGTKQKLEVTVNPKDAAYDAVVWTSGDEEVATVDETGTVKAVGLGVTKIKAEVGEKFAECEVTVYIAATGITLNKTELGLSVGGTSVKLEATVEPWNVSESEKSVTWSSKAPEIATVDGEGNVTPVAVGETVVTAACGEFTATCKVTVSEAATVWTVGDYYEADGNKGIVCWVSDDAQHGKIVSLDQKNDCVWATEETRTYATSETDGKANTEKIRSTNPTFRGYDSFKWCVDHGEGWYFPSCDEVSTFMVNAAVINETLKKHDGTQIDAGYYYWTSTEAEDDEDGEIMAYQTSLKKDGTPTSSGEYKADDEYVAHVRAMYEF